MNQEHIRVDYSLPLTGSQFFDTVIHMQARALARRYPGVGVTTIDDRIIISGQLAQDAAHALRRELDIDE